MPPDSYKSSSFYKDYEDDSLELKPKKIIWNEAKNIIDQNTV